MQKEDFEMVSISRIDNILLRSSVLGCQIDLILHGLDLNDNGVLTIRHKLRKTTRVHAQIEHTVKIEPLDGSKKVYYQERLALSKAAE